MDPLRTRRLGVDDRELARQTFLLIDRVFEDEEVPLGDRYLDQLLANPNFWAFAALLGTEVVGGITAHTLPMTRDESSEVFIYDIAVGVEHQRRGVGRALIAVLRAAVAAAGIGVVFVPADNDDTHALEFYRSLGGQPAAVTIFDFPVPRKSP